MNDKDKVTVTCSKCHNNYEMTYGRYRRKKNEPLVCINCYYAERTEKFRSKSQEERDAWQAKMQEGNAKRSPEEKAETFKKIRQLSKERWANRSEEEQAQYRLICKERVNARSDEEKALWRSRISEAQKKVWAKLDAEQRREKMKPVFDGSHRYWDNITEDELARNHQLISDGLRRYYSNAKPEDNAERWRKIGEAHRRYWNSLTQEEQLAIMKPIWDAQQNDWPTEIDFRKLLQSEGFLEQTNFIHGFNTMDIGYTHPDFTNIFGKYSPVSKSLNFPFHRWDFIVIPSSGPLILIDIDGSIHKPGNDLLMTNKAGVTFSKDDYMSYQDSKRPYQIPDGFIAYAILAYDDILHEDTPVKRIGLGIKDESMDLKSFVELLKSIRLEKSNDQ